MFRLFIAKSALAERLTLLSLIHFLSCFMFTAKLSVKGRFVPRLRFLGSTLFQVKDYCTLAVPALNPMVHRTRSSLTTEPRYEIEPLSSRQKLKKQDCGAGPTPFFPRAKRDTVPSLDHPTAQPQKFSPFPRCGGERYAARDGANRSPNNAAALSTSLPSYANLCVWMCLCPPSRISLSHRLEDCI